MPLDNPRRIFARPPRHPLVRMVPWLMMLILVAGASAAAGAILAVVPK